jgi:hypothetical protein
MQQVHGIFLGKVFAINQNSLQYVAFVALYDVQSVGYSFSC